MAAFTTEAAVRLKFQMTDTALVTADLVDGGIDDAHQEILVCLDDTVDTGDPPDNLVLGETLLAGARLLHSLASKDAIRQQTVKIDGQVIEAGDRFSSLMALSMKTEKAAWRMLEPYLAAQPGLSPAAVTDSTEVLGETDRN